MTSPRQADTLLWEGEQAISAGDYRALPGVNERLRRLLPTEVADQVMSSGRLKDKQ
ncbi:hypothetical protein [Fodinicola feengrottensis]|nr:hypothetical protein [Fodinicola feengrottensis]